jgi:DNA-binding ferritin-like protein
MKNVLEILLMAQRTSLMWHWKVKSFSMHLALGELYEKLTEMMDDLAEMYMGKYGTEDHVELSRPSPFSEQDPIEFIRQLHSALEQLESTIPQDGFIVNKYQEIQAMVSTVKYKLENLS